MADTQDLIDPFGPAVPPQTVHDLADVGKFLGKARWAIHDIDSEASAQFCRNYATRLINAVAHQTAALQEAVRERDDLAREVEEYANDRVQLSARLSEALEALRPFVNIKDQYPASAALINKRLDELTMVSLSVTKGQFRAAHDVLALARLPMEGKTE